MRKRMVVLLTAATALLLGCASRGPVQLSGVTVADLASVANCKYLDTVYGTSAWYGALAEKGIENARLSAFDKAERLGATHITWEPIPQNHGSSTVAAKAYRCG